MAVLMSVQNNADEDNFPKSWEESNRGGKNAYK